MGVLNSITNEFLVNFIANSISLDTSLVTKEQVEKILDNQESGLDEKLEKIVKNYLDAFLYAMTLASNKTELTENILKDLHEKVVDGISVGGLYRNVDISIKGSNHTPCSYIKVYDRMAKYFITINDNNNDTYYNVAFSHLQLLKVHPFLDGNGRLARIILNFELVKNDLKPIYIDYNEKEKYFEMVEDFKVNKNINSFIDFLKSTQN